MIVVSKKNKSAEQIRAELDALKAREAEMRRALRKQQRAEAAAKAAAKAESDRKLADAMLACVREAIGCDATDAELLDVVQRVLALKMHDQPVAPWALSMVREHHE